MERKINRLENVVKGWTYVQCETCGGLQWDKYSFPRETFPLPPVQTVTGMYWEGDDGWVMNDDLHHWEEDTSDDEYLPPPPERKNKYANEPHF